MAVEGERRGGLWGKSATTTNSLPIAKGGNDCHGDVRSDGTRGGHCSDGAGWLAVVGIVWGAACFAAGGHWREGRIAGRYLRKTVKWEGEKCVRKRWVAVGKTLVLSRCGGFLIDKHSRGGDGLEGARPRR